MPKKIRNLHYVLCSPETIIKAQHEAQKGKSRRKEILRFNENIVGNLDAIYDLLRNNTYYPSPYRERVIKEPKERVIKTAPFFPDRIVHKCVMLVFGDIWRSQLIDTTYACIKGRGITKCLKDINKALKIDKKGTQYCLKLDVKKFYDSVNHEILKSIIREKVDDERALVVVDRIIDSAPGLPIGNETSQTLANLYLSGLDRFIKKNLRIKYYYRYMDDMVFLSETKDELWKVYVAVKEYLEEKLKLKLKKPSNPFPIDRCPIDFVGYKSDHKCILLRRKILYNFYKKLNRAKKNGVSIDENVLKHEFSSYWGFLSHCTEKHRINVIKMSTYGKAINKIIFDGPPEQI